MAFIMSMLNTQMICCDCKDKERADPSYKSAEARDLRQHAAKLREGGMVQQAETVEGVAKKLDGG
tara:strand:- start:897 stop:1091 length:195 start_codon:yes stop_codon:yes gene_type:complete